MAMRALFAGLSVLHVAGAKTCSVVSGTHYVTGGHDVRKVTEGSSGDCAKACEANSECCVAEFDSNAKLCYLKYAGAVKGAAKGIYAVQCTPACGASPPSPPPTPKPSPAPPSPTPPVTPPPVTPPPTPPLPPPAPPAEFGGACDCSPDGCPALGPECTPKKVLWLPLGDSITWGCNGPTVQDCHNDSGGYRVPLALALSQHPLGATAGVGFDISTMGTLETGPPYVPRKWLKHEGHPGWRIYQIDALLNQSLATSATPPDLITIHLGTNDCLGGEKIDQMVGYMNSLLGHIYAAVPQAQVFLSDVIASGYKGWGDQQIPIFNKELPGMVDAWTAKGMKVFLVSAYDAMQPGCGAKTAADHDLCGGGQIHPTSAGYPRMASAFALSIMRNFKAP